MAGTAWVGTICLGITVSFGGILTAQESSRELPVEAVSLDGRPLHRPAMTGDSLSKLAADHELAVRESSAVPSDPHRLIWVGRRLGYLWRYQDAIAVFTEGIQAHPDLPHLYRHRGHRYISIRKFDLAIADLQRAASLIENCPDEIEPDGAPNAAGIPTSTLHSNIWYHLALAHYLKGDFEPALEAWQKCLAVSRNDDMRVATLDWMYMTLRRLERSGEAAGLLDSIGPGLTIVENHSYHRRLLMYQGKLTPDDLVPAEPETNRDLELATYGYGIGNWYLVSGDRARAREVFEKVVAGKHWSAFGFIAAEADLVRMAKTE